MRFRKECPLRPGNRWLESGPNPLKVSHRHLWLAPYDRWLISLFGSRCMVMENFPSYIGMLKQEGK
jgi:hypothetical protein